MGNKGLELWDSPSWRWAEYDSAAEWCAMRGLKGEYGDPLPTFLDAEVFEVIQYDPESFSLRVSDFAYAIAMEKHEQKG